MSEQTAWSIVREEIKSVMAPDFEEGAKPLYDFLMQDTAPYKCFLRMKMQGLYRDVSRVAPGRHPALMPRSTSISTSRM